MSVTVTTKTLKQVLLYINDKWVEYTVSFPFMF